MGKEEGCGCVWVVGVVKKKKKRKKKMEIAQ